MLTIFTDSNKPRGAISLHPSVPRLKELVKINVQRLIDYYHSNVRAVRNDHPFVQVLKHLPTYTGSPIDLFNIADSRFPYLSKNFKFTTDFNRGSFKGYKVYPCSDNMIYAKGEYVRPYDAVDNWKTLKPLKSLWTSSNFLDMGVPDNRNLITDGFNAVSIDIPQLALMYRGFYEMQTDDMLLGEDQFVGTYLLPSIVESQVDMSCISSTIALFEGNYISQTRVNTQIYLPSYGIEFQKAAMHALNRIEGSRMLYLHMLQSIPCIYHENAANALTLPDFAPTTQVEWAMLATRLKVINFLLDVGGKAGRDANKGFIQHLKPYCRDIQSQRIPYTEMSDSMATFIDDSLVRIRNLK